MNFSENFQRDAEKPLVVAASDITNHRGYSAMFEDVPALDGELLAKFRPSILIGAALIT